MVFVFLNYFSFHLRWWGCLRFSSCSEQSLKLENVTFSLHAWPLFIGIIDIQFKLFVFSEIRGRCSSSSTQLAAGERQLLTHRAETSSSPSDAPATANVVWDNIAWGAQPPTAAVWIRSKGMLAFQGGLALQFLSDQAPWDKYHPELFCETAVHINNYLETCGNWAGCCVRHANWKSQIPGEVTCESATKKYLSF